MSVEHQPGACLAEHRGALARGLKEGRQDAKDNVAKLTEHRQVGARQVLLPQDVHPQARFPVPQLVAAERRAAAQRKQALRQAAQQQ
jgi:hypothetical protein